MTTSLVSILLRALGGLLLALCVLQANAQPGYPSRPIRVLVGVPPGGSTDALTRMLADWLQESMGQPTVVENRPGANTAVAADAVARAAPDGHTLLFATEALLTIPLLTQASFDPFKDFAPVGTLATSRFVYTVHPGTSIRTVPDLIAAAKANPGKLSYGTSGNASVPHLAIEKLKMITGMQIVHIPYRGAGPAMTDAIAGQYELAMWTPLAAAAQIKAGKLRAIAVTGPRRLDLMPEVPTFAEAGLPAYDQRTWFSVYVPAGTPRAIVDRLNSELSRMLASPRIRKKMEESGVEPFQSTPEQQAAAMRADSLELGTLIKAAEIRMD